MTYTEAIKNYNAGYSDAMQKVKEGVEKKILEYDCEIECDKCRKVQDILLELLKQLGLSEEEKNEK